MIDWKPPCWPCPLPIASPVINQRTSICSSIFEKSLRIESHRLRSTFWRSLNFPVSTS
jgi:hypothetical protein